MTSNASPEALAIVAELQAFIEKASTGAPGPPVKPSHRVPFHWPPHPVSKDYHVLPSDWTGRSELNVDGEVFEVHIARTAQGVFGRVERVWNEARAGTVEEVLEKLRSGAEPFFRRQRAIAETIGATERFQGAVRDLEPVQLVKLLYCPDRDVAHEAQLAIETQASSALFSAALIAVLRDASHPNRRSAQWCVLDMFEDLPSFCTTPESQADAVNAIRDLLWSASDDYARTIYKAGVVLGGHVCSDESAKALIECIGAPSKFGRRSAIHAVFHLAEWMPHYRAQIIAALTEAQQGDPEPALREFAGAMASDIEAGAYEHMTEPAFPEED
ncbi:MAG: hypothetical protein JSS66_02460 [Armatimonadetes bacterium]|nr:hypothetical protein [Armatimonadota bacterium]